MEHWLRIATLVVAAIASVATTTVASVQHLSAHHQASRRAVQPFALNAALLGAVIPLEHNGRVTVWQNQRLLAAEAAAARATPTPRAAVRPPAPPPAVSYPAGSIQDIITKAFTPYGATAVAWGLRVARCESGYNPRAYNPAGPYYGLFQFLMSTFRATPYGGQDIYDPVANASAAAWKYGQGGAGAWGCR